MEFGDDLAMPLLKMPPITVRTEMKGQKKYIFDIVRKKMVVLTPEEWVRQHVIHYLVHESEVPLGQIAVESGMKVNRMSKRTDLQVFKNGKPTLLVECKAPEVIMNDKVLAQALRYNLKVSASLVMLTNGIRSALCVVKESGTEYLEKLPTYAHW